MDLREYLERERVGRPLGGLVGVESARLSLCRFQVSSGKLNLVDGGCMLDAGESFEFDVPAGFFEATVVAVAFGTEVRIGSLRLSREGADGVLGAMVGRVDTDSGCVCFCDLYSLIERGERRGEDWLGWIGACYRQADPFAPIVVEGESAAFGGIVSSGFGDGSYDTYELVGGGGCVGWEIQFIPPGTHYP